MNIVPVCAVLCSALFITKRILAQDDALKRKTFEGSLVFGANICKVDGDTYTGYHKIGIQAGGQVYVHFSPRLGVSMDLLYAQKGARGGEVKESYALGTYFDKYYLNLNYIEVPLTFHFNTGFFDYEAGISYARLITSAEWAEADVPVVIDPVLSRFNSDDWNYVLGVTVPIHKHWYGSIRYQYSIVPVRPFDRIPPRYSQYGVDQYNSLAVFRVVYML
jgi:outer membrane protein with beta-barrel domain